MLLEILEESIRTIWRFIRADKYAHTAVFKCQRGTEAELQDPADSNLLMEIQTNLQKVRHFVFHIILAFKFLAKP